MSTKNDYLSQIACSFSSSTEDQCGQIAYKKTWPKQILPLTCLNTSVDAHLQKYLICRKSIDSESELLKIRAGLFNEDNDSLTICPKHRYALGVGWRPSKLCSLGWTCDRKSKGNLKGTITKEQSFFVKIHYGILIGIGSGVCSNCRKVLVQRMVHENQLEELQVESSNAPNEIHLPVDLSNKEQLMCDMPVCVEANINKEAAVDVFTEESSSEATLWSQSDQDSQGSLWYPGSQDKSSQDEYPGNIKRARLDEFLASCDISPVKKQLQCDWNEASERTKRDYIVKAKKVMHEVLNVFAPGQADYLSGAIFKVSSKPPKDYMLNLISTAYTDATDWGTQRQILSLVANNYSLQDIKGYIPDLSKYKYTAARKHAVTLGSGQPVMNSSYSREGLTDQQINHFMDFMMSPCIMTDAPHGETKLKTASGEVFDVPKIILNSVRSRVIEQYQSFCFETNFSHCASTRSYLRILQAVEPNIRKCMRGLDNYAADGAKAIDDLKQIAENLGKLGMGSEWQEKLQKSLTAGKQYLKIEYKMHLSDQSEIPDHCCQFALSDDSGEFSVSCGHQHNKSCSNCEGLQKAMESIQNALKSVKIQFESEDQRDETQYIMSQACKAIEEWKKHILRTVNQDGARTEILTNLSDNEVFIERDWAMKFLPMVYRESQSKWFAKRGINWHLSVGSYRKNGDLRSHTIVHLFDSATQDAATSNSILLDTLKRLHKINPTLKIAYIRSDNAGCFHSYSSVFGIKSINKESPILVSRVDFADPRGKSICDRRAAHLKSTVRKYVNEGNDVKTASEFLKAVKNSNSTNTSIVVATPSTVKPIIKVLKQCPLKNITSFYNFMFKGDGMKVWKQYGIGSGKYIPYRLCFCEDDVDVQNVQILENFNTVLKEKPVTMRREKSNTNVDSGDQSTEQSHIENENGLFSCPETNCLATFAKYGNLMLHLDIGNHSFVRSCLSLSDRAKMSYSSKIDTKCITKPQMDPKEMLSNSADLGKGWALKCKREIKRFSDKQKNFLLQKFDLGEKSGMKCDPEDVSAEMRVIRDKQGSRIFSVKEFLSASQIGSYFSRLCMQKRKKIDEKLFEEDYEAADFENNFQHLATVAKQ